MHEAHLSANVGCCSDRRALQGNRSKAQLCKPTQSSISPNNGALSSMPSKGCAKQRRVEQFVASSFPVLQIGHYDSWCTFKHRWDQRASMKQGGHHTTGSSQQHPLQGVSRENAASLGSEHWHSKGCAFPPSHLLKPYGAFKTKELAAGKRKKTQRANKTTTVGIASNVTEVDLELHF